MKYLYCCFMSLLVLSGAWVKAEAQDVTIIARTGDEIDGRTLTLFGSRPQLNDDGTASFLGFFAGGTGIFTQNSLLAETGDTFDPNNTPLNTSDDLTVTGFGPRAPINANGDVAFRANFVDQLSISAGRGIFINDLQVGSNQAQTGVTTYDAGVTFVDAINGSPDLSNDGTVLFRGGLDNGNNIIATQDTILVETSVTTYDVGTTFVDAVRGDPTLNTDGTGAVRIGLDNTNDGISTQDSILVETNVTTYDGGTRDLTNVRGNPDLNDGGTVVFTGRLDDPTVNAILTQDSIIAEEGVTSFFVGVGDRNNDLITVDTTFTVSSLTGDPAINIDDDVVYGVNLNDALVGTIDALILSNSLLVLEGDAIDVGGGEILTLTGISLSPHINNNGVVVFRGGFTSSLGVDFNGSGIFFASVAVPEPSTIALLGIGLVGLVGVSVRRKGKKKEVNKS